ATVFWHRLVVGLSVNPSFPFPGLEAMFDDCVKYAEGLRSGIGDRSAGCIGKDYMMKHGLPIDTPPYSGQYEAIMAKQFFKIMRAAPHEVFETLFYYKYLMLRLSLAQALTINLTNEPKLPSPAEYHFVPYPGSAIGLVAVAVVIGFAHLLIGGW